MKNLCKKFLTACVVMAMVCAMAIPAFAAEVTIPSPSGVSNPIQTTAGSTAEAATELGGSIKLGTVTVVPNQSRMEAAEQCGAHNLQELMDYYKNSNDAFLIDIANEVIGLYQDDPVFEKHFNSNWEDAIGMVKHVIDGQYLYRTGADIPSPQFTVGGVRLIQQTQKNNCSAACTLMALSNWGQDASVPGSTDAEKQNTIFYNYYGGIAPSTDAIAVVLNSYLTSAYPYDYLSVDGLSVSQFKAYVDTSFNRAGAVIMQTNPSELSYYPSTATNGHYIVMEGLVGDTAYLCDPHYDNAYFGRHTEPVANCLEAIKNNLYGHYMVGKF